MNNIDLTKYDFTKTPANWKNDWCIDRRHWNALHAMAMLCTGNVVEIGCFRGYSTAAFVEALNAGSDFTLHLVDIKITPELRRVVGMCRKPGRIHIHEMSAAEFRLPDADLFWIDGDHRMAACLDVLNALASNARIIAMHDTNAHAVGYKECEGSYFAAHAVKAMRGREHIEDAQERAGELTQRGFLASFAPEAPVNAYAACKSALDAPAR